MTIATEAPKKTLPIVPPEVVNDPKYGPTLELNQHPAKRYPFRFGPVKAHLILMHLDAIKAFADEHPL